MRSKKSYMDIYETPYQVGWMLPALLYLAALGIGVAALTMSVENNKTIAELRFLLAQSNENIPFDGDLIPSLDNTFDIGSSTLNWKTVRTRNLESNGGTGPTLVGGARIIGTAASTLGWQITSSGDDPLQETLILLPDPGVASTNMMLTDGTQLINGAQTFALLATLNGGILLPTSGGTATPLTYNEEGTHTTTLGGIFTVPIGPIDIQVKRIQGIIMLQFPQGANTADTASFLTFTTLLPPKWRPTVDVSTVIYIVDSGVNKFGLFTVTASGFVTVYTSPTLTNFVGSGTSGIRPCSLSYSK